MFVGDSNQVFLPSKKICITINTTWKVVLFLRRFDCKFSTLESGCSTSLAQNHVFAVSKQHENWWLLWQCPGIIDLLESTGGVVTLWNMSGSVVLNYSNIYEYHHVMYKGRIWEWERVSVKLQMSDHKSFNQFIPGTRSMILLLPAAHSNTTQLLEKENKPL